MNDVRQVTAHARQLAPGFDMLLAPMKFRLAVVVEPSAGSMIRRIMNVDGLLVIGRDPSADLTLTGTVISRRHVLVRAAYGGLEIEDVSCNGTLVEGIKLRRASLRVGRECTLNLGCARVKLRRVMPPERCLIPWSARHEAE